MSESISNNNDRVVVELYDPRISGFPIEDPEELENILIHASDKLTDSNDAVILEALLNTLIDYYVFDIEPGDDIEDVGFLVSDIEDRVCNAVAFRRHFIETVSEDPEDRAVDDEEDENNDLPVKIEDARFDIPIINTC